MKPASAVLLVVLLIASAALVLVAQNPDPLAPYRMPDGSLHIPGGAFTPELQRALFGGNELQPYLNLSHYAPARSPYPTAQLVPVEYLTQNPYVFTHPRTKPETLADGMAKVFAHWFPPMDWSAALRGALSGVFGLLTFDARAAVAVDTTTVTNIGTAANTCTTSQTTGASDNAVLVMLSERGTVAFQSVTYGTATLTLITNTAANGGTVVRTEIWGFVGTLPAGTVTMTAALPTGQSARMTCATVLLQGVVSPGSFINGTSNTAVSANATVPFTSAITQTNLGFAVAALQNTGGAGAAPTAVTGTGATATDLYGVAVTDCTGGGAGHECAAGADIPNPGTAITWTNVSTTWVVSAVEVVAIRTCGTLGGANCYRINNGGAWNNTNNWSNSPGGASCGCAPVAGDVAVFNATPTGTTTLSAATTIAGIDMTGFTGTLDTSNANNWPLTVNGNFTIQGTFLPRGSAVAVTGNVTVLGATTVVTMSTSVWTVNGTWTNNSTSGTWSAGTGSVTIRDTASGTLTFGNLGVNEFNNLTLDASVAAGLTYTMAVNGLRLGGTLLIQNSTVGATGPTVLDTSVANLGVTAGAVTLATFGAFNTEGSGITVNGSVNVSAASGYVTNAGGAWTVTGAWTDVSTAASWSFVAPITFRSGAGQTMTFGPQAGNEFTGAVTFDASIAAGVTYTMAGANPLDVGGLLTIQNTAGGATGAVILDTSAANLAANAAGLALSTWGTVNSRASTVTVGGSVNISAGTAYITNTGGSWTVTGSWTDRSSSASWSFAATVVFRSALSQSMIFTGSNLAGNEFGGAVTFDTTATGGVTYVMAVGATGDSSLRIGGTLTLRNTTGGATAATILDTSAGNFALTAGSLVLGTPRGALKSEASTVTINGTVNVSDANSYLVLGSASWTVAGSWNNGSTDSTDWSAGTGTVTFRNGANATMTFANLGANEFNNVLFDGSVAAGLTYTLATNGLRAGGTVTVQNTAATPTGNVVLSTSAANLALSASGIVLGTRGTLTANGSTITVNGSWTSTAANHVWNKGASTVVFAASGTLTMSAGESFNILTQSAGTTTLGSAVTVTGATTVNGTVDASASNFTLTLQSSLAIGATGVLNLEASTASTSGNVTIAAGGAVRFTGAGTWTINGAWTDSNAAVPASWAVSTSTVRFVGAAATTLTFWTATGSEFNNLVLDSSAAAGFTYGQVNALRTAGTLTVQNTAGGATGPVVFDASASNYASTLGGLTVGALGAYTSRTATVTVNGNASIAASGYVTSAGAGTWTVAGSWTNNTTSASWSFSAPITFSSAANQTMTFKATATEFGGSVTFDSPNAAGTTYILATNALTLAGLLTIRNSTALPTGNTTLDTSAANLAITAGSVTLGTNGTLVARGATISVGGNWTATAANATFTAGTSTVVFTAAATINMIQAFNNLTVSAGTASLAAALTVGASLTVSGGTLAKGTNGMTLATVTLSGGAITSTSGNVTISGSVNVSSASSYIAFGSETWTITGPWSNGSTSASWSVGTATVLFNSASNQTLSFMAGAANEFYNVTFNSGSSTATFTLGTNGLRAANLLTLQGTPGTTTLSTSGSNLPIAAVTLIVAAGGSLVANGSTITVKSMDTSAGTFTPGTSIVVVNASGGTINVTQTVNNLTVNSGISTAFTGNLTFAGTLTLTSASPTFSGNLTSSGAATVTFGSATISIGGSWDTSSAASFTSTSSAVTFTGAAKTVALAAGQSFAALSVSGTLTQLSQVTATSLTLSAGSLTKGTNPLTVNGNLTLSGGALISTAGAVLVTGNVNVSAAASYIASGSEAWTVSGSWTNASTSASWSAGTATVTFNSPASQTMVFAGTNLIVPEFSTVVFDTTAAAGVTYTMSTRGLNLSGNLTIQNTAPSPTGNTVLTTSAANLPISTTGTVATSATGTLTANGSMITFQSFNASAGTFNAGTSTLVAGTTGGTINAPQTLNNLTVNAGVTLTAASNLTVNGTMTVAGVFVTLTFNLTVAALAALSGGITAGASGSKTFSGNVTVNAGGYFSFGGASWSFNGAWTDNSTSASWSAGTATVTFASATGGTMTFAGANLAGNEFSTVVFTSAAATAQTFTMASRALNAGTLQISDASSTTTLDTSAANLAINATTVTVGAGGALTARGSVITVTSIDTSGGTFTAGTSTVVISASSGTVNIPQILNNLTVNAGVATTFASNVTWSGTLTLTSSTPTFNGNLTSSGAATATFGSATIGIAGSWDTSSAASVTSTASSVTFSGTAKTVRFAAGQSFAVLTVTGTLSQLSQLTATSLAIPSGSLTKGTNPLTVTGNVSLSGGALLSTSGNVSISGGVNVSSPTSYIAFGSEAWTVSGSWTNASTSTLWTAGTATVTFNASSAQTMTFAGANLAGNEFSTVVFNSGATAATFTMSTRGLTAGTITVQGGTAVTTLATLNLPLTATTLTVGANGSLSAGSSTITVQGINTSAGAFVVGTSSIVVNASSGTVNVPQTVYNLTVNPGITTTVASALAFSGTLTLTSATVAFNSDLVSSGAAAAIAFSGATLSLAGSWNTSTVTSANFTATSSSVTFSGASKSISISSGSGFAAVTITGTLSESSQLTVTSLAIPSGGLTKGTNPLTVNGNLSLSGGTIASTSGAVNVAGTVTISAPGSYIAFGSETWTIIGTWSNASTSPSWSAGTATVVFAPASSATFTFGNLGASEFNNVQFSPTSAATFTMSTNGLRWSGTLTLNANATLATSNLPLTGGSLTVGNGATLTANASAVSVANVSMTGGASGAINLTTGSWTVSGNWDTSGLGSTFAANSSSVGLTGSGKTVKLLSGEPFATLTIGGTIALASDLAAASLTVTGTLTKTGFNLILNALTAGVGTIVDGTVSVTGFSVTDNDPAAYLTFSVFSAWTANSLYAWTHTDTKTTDTITFTIGGQAGSVFNVYKNGTLFQNGSIAGGNITFSMLGSDPDVQVVPSGCGGNSRYWILGTGNWSDPSHWSAASGGVGGCSLPGNATDAFFDANSGTGTVTVDVNGSIATLTTTGSTIATIALGSNSLTTSGNVVLAAGTLTIGASAGTGLSVGGSLTLSGTAVLDGSGGASTLNVTGSVTVSSATAYLRMGSGTWTVSGAWSNASTSANWAVGTGTVVFNASSSQTMTFAGANLPGPEFYNVTFNSGASTTTFTLAARGLNVVRLVGVQGGTGVTTLDLSAGNLPLTTADITVAGSAVLNGRGSTIAVSGNWDSHLGTFTAGTSTVVLSGTSKTVNTASSFGTLAVSGSYTMGSALTAGATSVSGTLSTSASGYALNVGGLTITGTLTGNGSAIGVSGNWDSHLGTFTAGTSTVTLSGALKTLNTVSAFATLHVTGTISLASAVSAGTALTIDTNGTLDTSVAGYSLSTPSLTVGATGTLVGEGSTITVTSIDTHLGAFTPGTSTVVVNASGGSVNIPQTLTNLTVSPSVSTSFSSSITWSGTLTLTGAIATFASDLTSSGAATLVFGSATLSIAGNWNTASAATFSASGSAVTFTGAAKTITLAASQGFATLTVSGTIVLGSQLTASGLLTVSGTLDTTASNDPITAAGGLTVSGAGGVLRTNASTVAVTGDVSIGNAAAFIASSAGGAWTVTNGGWTNASTSASWSFAAPVTFLSGAPRTMTFGSLGPEFAGNVTFDANVAAGVTYTMAGNGLTVGGTLTVQNTAPSPTGSTVLNTSGSNLAIAAGTFTLAGTGALTANGSAITVTSMDTHLGTFNVGTSTIIVSASGGTVNVSQTAHNLTVNGGVSTSFTGSLAWSGVLTLTNATVTFGSSSLISSGPATMSFAAATITMGTGSWDTSSATTFVSAGSSVTFSGTGTVNVGTGSALAAATISAGTRTLLGPLTTNGLLTLSGGILAKGTTALTANAGITLSGGALTSISGAVSITGNVDISAAASFIAFGSETWTVNGSWTNASTSASWSAGTATVVFDAPSSQTMTFASLPGGAPEFDNVTFNGGASTVTFTMAGSGLAWSGTLTVQGGTATTTLATSDLGLNGGALTIGDGGVLIANASAAAVTNVSMAGSVSGTLVASTGLWIVSGNWDTSGAGASLSMGTSTVTFTGSSAGIRTASGQSFHNLTIAGTISLASPVTADATLTVADTAVLTKTGQGITFNGLSEVGTGRIVDGGAQVVNLTVTNSDPANLTTISVFSIWNLDSELNWTHSSTVGTSTVTFTIGGNSSGSRFMVTKDGVGFTNGMVNASGQVVFTMLGSDPVVDVIIAAPCGGIRYWVGGAGNWSQTAHWSATSGGAGGCSVPNSTVIVYIDGNAGSGTLTIDQNASMASLDTTGWTGTMALGALSLTINGNLNLAGGLLTIGASAGTGLTVTGDLTIAGAAALDGSGSASVVSVAGNVSITSATAFVRMGSGTWTFGGGYSNASTSASWSPGTGTVVFTSAASRTMTFAAFAVKEFYHVTFASAASSGAVTFTLGTNPLKWAGTLTIQDTSGSTTILATAGLDLAGGSLAVGNSGVLAANASSVTVANVTMTGGTSGTITLTTGAWTVSGTWDTSGTGSVFASGTSTVTMSGTPQALRTLNAANGFWNLTITGSTILGNAVDIGGTLAVTGSLTTAGNSITGNAALILSGGGTLLGGTASVTVASVTMNDSAANAISLTSGSLTVSGSWDTSGAASTFTAGTSTVTLSSASGTIALGPGQAFANLVLTGSYALASALFAASLTISAGILTKGTNPLTLTGDLVLSGGSLTSASGTVTIGGNVDIASAASYVAFGSEAWTISGSWTNASTSASWVAGSVIFNASSSETMTFAGSNLVGVEFNSVVFNSGAATVTFTMAGNGLRVHSLTIQGGSGTTTLDTSGSNLGITTDNLVVGAGGELRANSSVLTLQNADTSAGNFASGASRIVVVAPGGTLRLPQPLHSLTVGPGVTVAVESNLSWSGALDLTGAVVTLAGNLVSAGAATFAFGSGTLTISGSWDTSSMGALTSVSGSSVKFAGTGQTVALGAGQAFATLTVAGSLTVLSGLTAATLTVDAAATLTKTGHSITFNGLTVDGTIEDGSVAVTGLTVANSDATALVTISVFTTWKVGSEYAWTHTSSETSQTITWTIAGNTAHFQFRVSKDGSGFVTGTVDDSGAVVFTMLGSDPSMVVTLSAPPWWASPFFLPIPPIGFLMVVAMYVQRRRWRPAKAFLVDERGQMLREFTLDPACEVTYDQARKAGALDAVDKDVRVSRYHARAVHGDMLSLVMLAVGPANVEEVDFARGMLLSIQDKLDDHVKRHVEEMRAEEADLRAAQDAADRERSDMKVRSRVFGDLADAVTIARAKVDTDAAELHAMDADLREREERLAADRKTFTKRAADLEKKHASADRVAQELETKQVVIRSAEKALGEREGVLGPKEKDLEQRLAEASQKAAELAGKEEQLSAAQTRLASDLAEHEVRVQEAKTLQEELAEERKSLDELTIQIDQEAEDLKAKTAGVEAREREATATAERYGAKLAELDSREKGLEEHRSELEARETALAARQQALSAAETNLRSQGDDLAARESQLAAGVRDLAEERKSLDELSVQMNREAEELQTRTATVAEREKETAAAVETCRSKLAELGSREEGLEARASELSALDSSLSGRETGLAAQEKILRTQREELRSEEKKLAMGLQDLALNRKALDERKVQMDQQATDLASRTANVETREKEVSATAESYEAKLADLDAREHGLVAHARELGALDSTLREKEEGLGAREKEVRARTDDLQTRESKLATGVEELAEERKALDELTVQINQEAQALKVKTADTEAREKEASTSLETSRAKLAELETRERNLDTQTSELSIRELAFREKADGILARERELQAQADDLQAREAASATRTQELDEEQKALDDLTKDAVEDRKALDTKAATLKEQEADVSKKLKELTALKADVVPREAAVALAQDELAARETAVAADRAALQSQQDLVAAKALEIQQEAQKLAEREETLSQEKTLLQDARNAVEAERQEFEGDKAEFAKEMSRRDAQVQSQQRTLGEARMHLTKETEAFEAARAEKNQWIASKEIELEAKEQGLNDREAEIRAQAEENARKLSELAAREESLEIDTDKFEKARAEAETRKAELGAMSRDLEAKTSKFREEETRKGEELRTWQATLESEQALLKEQKDTFEKEMQEVRESWAGRMIRVEQKDEELKEREAKVQSDVEWVARNESELSKREKAAAESLRAANELKAQGERLRKELEQRSMELDSRERALREEAAAQSVDLERRTEEIQAQAAEVAGHKAQWERELATQTQKLAEREKEVQARAEGLDAQETDLASREATLQSQRASHRQDQDRLSREKSDLLVLEQQLDTRQLEATQARERLDSDALRLRTETDAVRQSLAAKEADLTSERERLERESSALQDTLGTKAKEMATREKAVAAREEELRSEEHDLEARTREIENRERQAEARMTELGARERALAQSEVEQKNRRTTFDEAVQKFEAESAARQKQWKELQATLKTQEAQIAATAESRQAEIRKRMEDLAQREQSLNATLTQAQIDRKNLEAQAKSQAAKQTEVDAAMTRAERRSAELKRMEDELLQARQTFESEKLGWSNRRSDELKQLEATRDATAEERRQAEGLIEEAQRRAYVAAEAEKAAKRQGEELAASQALLEKRRTDAEKAEKDLAAQTAQLRDASQRLGAKEMELAAHAKELDVHQAQLLEADRKTAETSEGLKARKASLDREAQRIATLAAQADKRQAEIETRHSAVEAKLADVTKREQVLSTELQRADNLMEDLNRKGAEIASHEKGLAATEQELAKREQKLAQRDSELREGMEALERLRREHEALAAKTEQEHRDAAAARKDADNVHTEAEKLKTQATAMQEEVAKNMRFLQKKALDVLDREEKIRGREAKMDEQNRTLEARAQILEQKDRSLATEKGDVDARLEKARQENEKLKAKLAETEKTSRITIDMDEWKRDIDNRVKIIQKKALDLLDREEKLRKKEEELKALADKLGVSAR